MDKERQFDTIQEIDIEDALKNFRIQIKSLADGVLYLKKHSFFKSEQEFDEQHGEMIANIMLSYRHLEDARMRIGKVMQQLQGGISIYDKE